MKTPKDKYQNDPEYNDLVRVLEGLIEQATFSPSEIRKASMQACINYHAREGNVGPEAMRALDVLESKTTTKDLELPEALSIN